MSKKFEGELNWINPKKIINEKSFNKLESFFLGLGVVYNDLKGLLLFMIMLNEVYEKPKKDELSVHGGNYGGINLQIQKLIAGTINEFFIFIKNNNSVYDDPEFKKILDRLSVDNKSLWQGIVDASNGKNIKATAFLKSIKIIRSTFTYHYDTSGKVLRNGYINFFFNKKSTERNKKAFYSIGDNFEKTRFFFADAAAEESLCLAIGKEQNNSKNIEEYQKKVIETMTIIHNIIFYLLKNFLQIRRNTSKI